MSAIFYITLGFLLALGILVNPATLFFMQRKLRIGTWKDECPTCGSTRLCYPTEKNGLQTGMVTTLIATECAKCGTNVDPSYVTHRPH